MSGQNAKRGKKVLLLLAVAVWVFPCLTALGLLNPIDKHGAIAAQRVGDAIKLPIFVAHSRERVGEQETVMAETIYFLPASVELLSVITISRSGAAAETKVDVSRFRGLVFVGLIGSALIYLGRWAFPRFQNP